MFILFISYSDLFFNRFLQSPEAGISRNMNTLGRLGALLDKWTGSKSHEKESQLNDPDFEFSEIDSGLSTPEWERDASDAEALPTHSIPPLDPGEVKFYLSRVRLWCCQCLQLTDFTHTAKTCPWCQQNLPEDHEFCDNCALVQITLVSMQPNMRYAFSSEALAVFKHRAYFRGGIGVHGPQFYLVECCKAGCSGSFRVDWDGAERRKDITGEKATEGLWVDFGDWLCPECGRRACKRCKKYIVGTQVLVGSTKAKGWADEGRNVEGREPIPAEVREKNEKELEESRLALQQAISKALAKKRGPAKTLKRKAIGQDPEILELDADEIVEVVPVGPEYPGAPRHSPDTP